MSSTFEATGTGALDDLMAWVGVDGLVAALRSPGLLAALDQHMAAVREALVARDGAVEADGLVGYARSVIAAAHRMGRPLPDPAGHAGEVIWVRAGWHLLRLVAICALADEAGYL